MASKEYERLPSLQRPPIGAQIKRPSLRQLCAVIILSLLVFVFLYMLGIYIWLFLAFIFAELIPQSSPATADILAVGFDVTESLRYAPHFIDIQQF